ncbi:MAG: glutamyl-tRNA reductase [Rhodospirillaceae bacterium]|nr:glutamyl-tRNA reductase [Rhodospirillaceae bacterium]
MVEDLGIVGISWRQINSEALSRFTLPASSLEKKLTVFAKKTGLSELAYLETCNRVEIIYSKNPEIPHHDIRPLVYELLTNEQAKLGEAERSLKAWRGEGACEHLFLVVAGLDSAAMGETEIVGQVRACNQLSRSLSLNGPRLELLFEEALRIAGEVRGETALGEGNVSLAEIAVKHIRNRIKRTDGKIVLIGVSPMTERAALSITEKISAKENPLIIVNRTISKAQILANRFNAKAMDLESFIKSPPSVEALLIATSAEKPVLIASVLERLVSKTVSGQPPLLIDMGVPANIDKQACLKLNLERIDMDDIVIEANTNRQTRLMEAAQARHLVDEALTRIHDRFAEQLYGPLLGALQNRFQHTAKEGVNRLLKKDLKGLGASEREAIQTWAEVLARRFAHIPTLGLRGLLLNGPEGSLEAFLQGLDSKFADELRLALSNGVEKHADNRVIKQ